jgi:dipeptidyl aminopeptidase/acylaminoacyl peptidase
MDKRIAPYGTWKSPISAADVATAQVRLSFPAVAGDDVWWQEGRPSEGGRTTVVAAPSSGSGPARDLLPSPWNARTRVHEYGGRSYLPVPAGSAAADFDLVFAEFTDQRLYLVRAGGAEPEPLTPDGLGFRFADLVLSPDGTEIWCVRETVAAPEDGGGVSRAIVAVSLSGAAASSAEAIRVLVTGADFFAFPVPSPDGGRLAWISWDHPRMPWDGTELRVAPVSGGPVTVADSTPLMGGPSESVLAPAWRDEDTLYVVSDSSGWWNLYSVPASGGAARPLCPREEEFAGPLWQLGGRPYAALPDGRLAVLHGVGESALSILDPATGALTDAGLPYRAYGAIAASGPVIATVAGGPRTPLTVISLTPGGSPAEIKSASVVRDGDYLPVPRQVALSISPNAPSVHALVYPPTSPVFDGPADELAPYVVWVHGGPTGSVLPLLDLEKAYFTSRGIGVIDVNYGGSTGYGRAYRQRLRGKWGIVDVADAMDAALALAEGGEADRRRLGIRGGSAGGWTALAAVTSGLTGSGTGSGDEPGHPPGRGSAVFAAAVSYFGVAELKSFAKTTHDFESRYLDGLIGALPEAADVYDERSPMGHVTPLTCPILLLQGLDDPIVPPAQSEAIAADLAAQGIPHAYITFEGESHGFRKAETIIASLEAELAFYGQMMGFTPPGVPPVRLA